MQECKPNTLHKEILRHLWYGSINTTMQVHMLNVHQTFPPAWSNGNWASDKKNPHEPIWPPRQSIGFLEFHESPQLYCRAVSQVLVQQGTAFAALMSGGSRETTYQGKKGLNNVGRSGSNAKVSPSFSSVFPTSLTFSPFTERSVAFQLIYPLDRQPQLTPECSTFPDRKIRAPKKGWLFQLHFHYANLGVARAMIKSLCSVLYSSNHFWASSKRRHDKLEVMEKTNGWATMH